MIIIKGRPISKKRSYHTRGKIWYMDKAYVKFRDNALAQLKSVKSRYTGKVDVDYVFELKGRLDADIDNLCASINDVLQDAGILSNDKNILSMTAIKEGGHKDWKTTIEITSL